MENLKLPEVIRKIIPEEKENPMEIPGVLQKGIQENLMETEKERNNHKVGFQVTS